MDIVGTDTKRVLKIRYKLMAMYHLCTKCIITDYFLWFIFNRIHTLLNSNYSSYYCGAGAGFHGVNCA